MKIDTLLIELSKGSGLDDLYKEAIIHIKILQKTIQILKKTTLGTNLCPDHRDKIWGKPCIMCEIEYFKRKLRKFEKND